MPYFCSVCGQPVSLGGSHCCRRAFGGSVIDDDDPVQLMSLVSSGLDDAFFPAGVLEDDGLVEIAGMLDQSDLEIAGAIGFRMIDDGVEHHTVEFVRLPHAAWPSGPMLLR